MQMYPIVINQTAGGTSFSFNTHPIIGGLCHQVYLAAALSDTTFEFRMTDADNHIVYDTSRRGGPAEGVLDEEVVIPMQGIYTLKLYNASTAEKFTGKIIIRET